MKSGNCVYGCPKDLPEIIPVFPLPEALLLPRAEMPLNIFEPRYVDMVDCALSGRRVIGMVQPDLNAAASAHGPGLCTIGCAGRITSFAETGDGRYMITLTGISRFRIVEEIDAGSSFRQFKVTAMPFEDDFAVAAAEETVDRNAVLRAFRDYLSANNLEADWDSVGRASNETLVNTLAMMAPFGAAEKQALLEAPDLRARAETLVAITEMVLAKEASNTSHSIQ